MATKFLKPYHFNINSCLSGQECIDKVNNGNKYDLILMDDMMPNMSGVEALNKLKKMTIFDSFVIVLTANALTGSREKYLSVGFDEYISKPISKSKLDEIINKLFSKNQELDNKKVEHLVNSPIQNNSYNVEYLKQNNIDVELGLSLLGDIDMYNETLKEFMNNISNRINKMTKYKNLSDMSNYAIEVHALKSDSKYLGFDDLADLAYSHELKSKENDIDYINQNYNTLINEVNKILKIVKIYLTK